MTADLLHLQLVAMQRIMQPAMDRERAALSGKRVRGRPPFRLVLAATATRPVRIADEPRMALAFALRRLDGIGYDRAANETAAEFRAIEKAKRPGIAVERAWTRWRDVVVPELIQWFPGRADHLREFLRERRR